MKEIVLILVGALVLLYIIYIFKRWGKKHSIQELINTPVDIGEQKKERQKLSCSQSRHGAGAGCSSCCSGQCGAESNSLQKYVDHIQYYDDEELDTCKGISPEDYTLEQIEQFREIASSLLSEDIEGWQESLKRRGIELPREIRLYLSERG